MFKSIMFFSKLLFITLFFCVCYAPLHAGFATDLFKDDQDLRFKALKNKAIL